MPWALALYSAAGTLVLAACGGGNGVGDVAAVPSSAIDAVVTAQEVSDQRTLVVNAADCSWSQGETPSAETFSGCQATAMDELARARAAASGLVPPDETQMIDPEGALAFGAIPAVNHPPNQSLVAFSADAPQPAKASTATRPEAVAMVSLIAVPKGTAKALISLKDL